MDLIEYRKTTGTTFVWIARQIGVTPKAVDAWARGIARPAWEKAGVLERITGGKVPRSQWYPPEAGLVPDPSPAVTDVTRITPVTPSPVT